MVAMGLALALASGAGLWLALTVHGCAREAPTGELPARPANVILIVIDTLRPDYLGCYGDPRGLSPEIDRLAADGILFETALCHSPITGPSHINLFTGRLPSETGVLNNSRTRLPERIPLLAELLRQHRYRTGAVVSIGPVSRDWSFGRGFETFDDKLGDSWILRANEVLPRALEVLAGLEPPFFYWAHFSDPHEPYDAHGLVEHEAEVLVGGKSVARLPTSTYVPTTLSLNLPFFAGTDVQLRGEYPFNVQALAVRSKLGLKPSLTPKSPPGDPVTNYRARIGAWGMRRIGLLVSLADVIEDDEQRRERYAREVRYVDGHVGALLDTLRARDLYDESLIVFASDHGEALGCHGHDGHVEALYDCMMRVPLIIKPPRGAGMPVGARQRDQAALVDVLPTVLGQLGLPAPAGCRGRDLLAAGAAESAADAAPDIFLETHRPEAERDYYGLRGQRYKIILDPEARTWELYDLFADPGEERNLYSGGDSLSGAWRERLLVEIASVRQAAPDEDLAVALDDETEEMLQSLGY